MGQALGEILPLAVAVAVFPVPIIAAVLMVGSDGGVAKGLAYLLGWSGGLTAVTGIVLAAAGASGAREDSEPATWVSLLLLALGLGLLVLAVDQWRKRPAADDEPPTPGWMRTIAEFTVVKAAGTGFALSALNPKNALLAAAAAAEIAEAGLSPGGAIVALVVFVLIASAGLLAPLVLSVALGDGAQEVLDGLRAWLARYNAVIMTVLLVLIGTKLIGDAISGLSA
ncbi:MAG TPA: GAP family protein [Gaiellaceae bacterium]|jgi:threonine/homoserine/homoserine lactone efflux protein|nr:GAP family protein [Gaiellaceae bacterium]